MIKRSIHSQNYTVLPNAVFEIKDGLAIGLLSYLLSKPPNWHVTKQQLYKHFTQGRTRIDSAFKLLEDTGYIFGEQRKDPITKQYIGFHWIVSDIPDPLHNSAHTETQLLENGQSVNGTLISKELESIVISKELDNSIDWGRLILYFNKCFGKNSRVIPQKAKTQFNARIKEGFTKEDIMLAMTNAKADTYHIETDYKYCTLEFFSRGYKLDKFMSQRKKKDSSADYVPTV